MGICGAADDQVVAAVFGDVVQRGQPRGLIFVGAAHFDGHIVNTAVSLQLRQTCFGGVEEGLITEVAVDEVSNVVNLAFFGSGLFGLFFLGSRLFGLFFGRGFGCGFFRLGLGRGGLGLGSAGYQREDHDKSQQKRKDLFHFGSSILCFSIKSVSEDTCLLYILSTFLSTPYKRKKSPPQKYSGKTGLTRKAPAQYNERKER